VVEKNILKDMSHSLSVFTCMGRAQIAFVLILDIDQGGIQKIELKN
jgi:hypothetical protein